MSEGKLKEAVMNALQWMPRIHPMRLNSGSLMVHSAKGKPYRVQQCESGTPDILVLLPRSRCIWLELKTEDGKLRESQRIWHDKVTKLDHVVHVVRDVPTAISVVTRARDAA
jgi:hypothetical protein